MSAFAETLAQASAPAPGGSTRTDSYERHRARRDMQEENPSSTIQPGHRMAFHWLRSSDGEFGLVSCHVNGKPSALIVAARERGPKTVEIMPLFVALTEGMTITGPDGDVIYENGGVA